MQATVRSLQTSRDMERHQSRSRRDFLKSSLIFNLTTLHNIITLTSLLLRHLPILFSLTLTLTLTLLDLLPLFQQTFLLFGVSFLLLFPTPLASFCFLASNCLAFETFGFEFLKLKEGSESEKTGEDKVETGGASRSWGSVTFVVRKWVVLEGGCLWICCLGGKFWGFAWGSDRLEL